jgi:acetyltransferase-like isoleucine patch superfamily enzyme
MGGCMGNIGHNSIIKAKTVNIPDTVIIGDNVYIECESFEIGEHSRIGNNVKITCRQFNAGEFLYMCDDVEVGRGGCYGPNSNVHIGNHVGIFEKVVINPSDEVHIDVGIGSEVMIWTHGAWLDVLQGFPSDFGPVSIGKNVWLPARCIMLPNTSIGNDTVIGIGSIINKDIPSGCLAAGSPCKVIRENCYPHELTNDQINDMINNIITDYYDLLSVKDMDCIIKIDFDMSMNRMRFKQIYQGVAGIDTIFDLDMKTISPTHITEEAEDFRDYLRRRGVKFYTNEPFKSIKPNFL